jgi:hypothetical protein
MERIAKIGIISLLIGVALLLLDLLFCLVALANMDSIGSKPEWQALTGGTIVAAAGFIGFSVITGLLYAIIKTTKN